MSVVLEPVTDVTVEERDADEPLECHLYRNYPFFFNTVTCCGLPVEQDRHNTAHPEVPREQRQWEKGMMACPICGAPICVSCLLSVS